MNTLIRFYNKNRKEIWIGVFIVVIAFVILQTLNNYAKQSREESSSSNTTTYSAIYNNKNYAVVSEETIDERVSKNTTYVVENFINYCNSKDTKSAYNLLSEDCRNTLYPTEEEFIINYYNFFFKNKKTYNIQAWIIGNGKFTYRIELEDNILATGKIADKKTEEYYTVVNVGGKYELNINKYIGKETINKTLQKNNVKITVLSKDIYLDRLYLNLKIENFSNNKIILGDIENDKSIILTDTNNFKYNAPLYEFIEEELIVFPKIEKNLTIKFLRSYKPKYKETKIEFNNIVLNYGTNSENKILMEIEL